MRRRTHSMIGAALGLALALNLHQQSTIAIALMVVTSSAAVAPDLDIRLGLRHRGISHSLFALALVAVAAFMCLPDPLRLFIPLGYGSHLGADMLTPFGVPLLYPAHRHRFRLARIRTGGMGDNLIGAAAGVVVTTLLLSVRFINP